MRTFTQGKNLCQHPLLSPHTGRTIQKNRFMINKIYQNIAAAVADIPDEAVIMVGGFGDSGVPENLIRALAKQGANNLTVISNSAGSQERGIAMLFRNNQIKKLYASFPGSGREWRLRRAVKGRRDRARARPPGDDSGADESCCSGLGSHFHSHGGRHPL